MSNTRFCGVKNWEILHVLDEKDACGVPHDDIFIEDVEVALDMEEGMSGR